MSARTPVRAAVVLEVGVLGEEEFGIDTGIEVDPPGELEHQPLDRQVLDVPYLTGGHASGPPSVRPTRRPVAATRSIVASLLMASIR